MDEQCQTGITEVAEGPSICTPTRIDKRTLPTAVQEPSAFGVKIWLNRSFEETLGSVRRALQAQGFMIAFEMNVGEVLRADPGVKFPDYHIIGAWYPSYEREVLQTSMDAGLLMPQNIIIYEHSDGTVVAAADTIAQFELIDGRELQELAILIKQRLDDVIGLVAAEDVGRAA